MNFQNLSKINDLLGVAVLNIKHLFTEGTIKHGVTVVSEKYSRFVSHVSSGSANSIITIHYNHWGYYVGYLYSIDYGQQPWGGYRARAGRNTENTA